MNSRHISFTRVNFIVLVLILLFNFPARATEYRVISKSGVNVRQGPGTQYKIIGTASYDKIVSGDTTIQGWIRIAHPSLPLQGYIKADLLECAEFNSSKDHTFIVYPIIILIAFILSLTFIILFKHLKSKTQKHKIEKVFDYKKHLPLEPEPILFNTTHTPQTRYKCINPQQKSDIKQYKSNIKQYKSTQESFITEAAFIFFDNLAAKLCQQYPNHIEHDISSDKYWYIKIPYENKNIKLHYAIILDLEHECKYQTKDGNQYKHIDLAVIFCKKYEPNISKKSYATLLHIEIDGDHHYKSGQIRSDMWRSYFAATKEHVPTIHLPNRFTNNEDTINTIADIIQNFIDRKLKYKILHGTF